IQMIFQDPYASLNPRMKVGDIISEPLIIHNFDKSTREKKAKDLREIVGLRGYQAKKYHHEFRGGQRQKKGQTRAIIINPELIIADGPFSYLNVSIKSQILILLDYVQEEFKLTYVIIGHDLSDIEHISDRVEVMYLGKLDDLAPKEKLYAEPLHPYAKA